MAPNKPLWLRGVEAADRLAAPALEGAVNHEAFSIGLSVLGQTRRAVFQRTERLSRKVLHGLNLPTASDVNRLLLQIARVENRLRLLDAHLEVQIPSTDVPASLPSGSDAVPR